MQALSDRIGETNFLWAQALWLPRWKIHCHPTSEQAQNIEKVASKLQRIQLLYPKADLLITSWLRPDAYNTLIGGATNSAHTKGMAVDFYFLGMGCDELRRVLESKLEEMQIRMEDLPGSSWVHIDVAPVVFTRFFKP